MEKRIFIDRFLKPMLKALDEDVESVRYMQSADRNEYVVITYKTGDQERACITGDNNKGIVKDVLKAMVGV